MSAKRDRSSLLLTLGLVLLVFGVLGGLFATVSMVISAFGDVAYVPASERAATLSSGIRDALLLGVLGGGSVGVIGGVVAALGLRGRRRGQRAVQRASSSRFSGSM